MRRAPPAGLARRILDESVAHLAEYVPQLKELKLREIMAATSWAMARRISRIGERPAPAPRYRVDASDDYYSVFTGKYTSAPANAMDLRALLA